jgi:DNA polymerase-3 subunit gamma/tau
MPDAPDTAPIPQAEPAGGAEPYRVLARKYRPAHFRDLIGQEAMVTTLTNAFRHDRIAHAFILTGVRGVGKTTTARIIAKGLNCTRQDGPTIDPCGACEACRAIARGAHVEVIEMDAASNTGVDYIREINEAVRYRPAEVRYKVYIIDEVHMLSPSSFNALLKTLEEPPEHVVFILATTEIRKVPVTVLSRCQRFDLRRIEPEAMMAHLRRVAEREEGRIDDAALGLITRAAEGSVRDALSLLDQALAIAPADGATGAADVRAMLGLADRGRVIDLFEAVMGGDAAAALAELSAQYAEGADPAVVLRDLAELTHWISVVKIAPEHADDPTVGPDERSRGKALAGRLAMRVLTRTWQMLLKALEEVASAPNAMMAAEMALIRLTHVADLPPPGDLVKSLRAEGGSAAGGPAPSGPGGGASAHLRAVAGGAPEPAEARAAPAPRPGPDPALAAYPAFEDLVAHLREARELRLLNEIESFVRLVAYRPGVIEFAPAPGTPEDFPARLSEGLRTLTGARWSVAISGEEGAPTIAEARREARARAEAEIAAHPMVAAVLEAFPEAQIRAIRRREPPGGADGAPADAPAEIDDETDLVDGDDPFEEM